MSCTFARLFESFVCLRKKFQTSISSEKVSSESNNIDTECDQEANDHPINPSELNHGSSSSEFKKLVGLEESFKNSSKTIYGKSNVGIENVSTTELKKETVHEYENTNLKQLFEEPFSDDFQVVKIQPSLTGKEVDLETLDPKNKSIRGTDENFIPDLSVYYPFVNINPYNALDNITPDSTNSETDSDTFNSVRSFRLKPKKISSCNEYLNKLQNIQSQTYISKEVMPNNGDSNQRPSESSLQVEIRNNLEERKVSSSSSGSDSHIKEKESSRRQWLNYSKWILKGQKSMESQNDNIDKTKNDEEKEISEQLEENLLKLLDSDEDTDKEILYDIDSFEMHQMGEDEESSNSAEGIQDEGYCESCIDREKGESWSIVENRTEHFNIKSRETENINDENSDHEMIVGEEEQENLPNETNKSSNQSFAETKHKLCKELVGKNSPKMSIPMSSTRNEALLRMQFQTIAYHSSS